MKTETLKEFLKDDLIKLEKNVDILVDMINTTQLHYSDTQKPNCLQIQLEEIEMFLSYWRQHAKNI